MNWHTIAGSIGVLLVVGAYLLLQLRQIAAERLSYSISNAAGAALILISLAKNFNLPAVLIETFWLVISIYGIFAWFRTQRAAEDQQRLSKSQSRGRYGGERTK